MLGRTAARRPSGEKRAMYLRAACALWSSEYA